MSNKTQFSSSAGTDFVVLCNIYTDRWEMIELLRSTYARIDLGALGENIETLKRLAGTPVMAVVKADAYGHGMKQAAGEAIKHGVHYFAVATPDEAMEFKAYYPEEEVLILSSAQPQAFEALIGAGVIMTAYTPEDIFSLQRCAEKVGKPARVHIKIDTGMGRIGLRGDDEADAVTDALKSCKDVRMEGMFTHFATADEADRAFTEKQFARFMEMKERFTAAGFKPICHAANSAAIIAHGNTHLDMCRMGISMYGYPPSGEVDMSDCPLKPVMSIVSYITHIKRIDAGDSVSYGRKHIAKEGESIATVAIGYADGYRRSLSNKARAFVNGREVRQVGRVCMDQIMLDVTGIEAREGDEVLLMGAGFDADDMAEICDTISYEILCGISKRVPRVYI